MSRITSTKPKPKTQTKTPSHPQSTSTRLPKKPQRLHLTQHRKPPRLHLRPPKKPQRLILRPPQKPILRDRSPNRQTPIREPMKIKKEEDTVEPLERISEAASDDIDTSTNTSAAENVRATKIKQEQEEEEAEDEDGEIDPLRTTWTAPVRSPRVRVPSEETRRQFWQGEVGGVVFGEVRW